MINVPDSIKILGLNYKVLVTDDFVNVIKPHLLEEDKDKEFFGYFVSECMTIFLDGKVSRQMLESTLIHEIIEVINSHLCMNIEHDNIERLECGLYQVLTENSLIDALEY